jgi:hypothetical protein
MDYAGRINLHKDLGTALCEKTQALKFLVKAHDPDFLALLFSSQEDLLGW